METRTETPTHALTRASLPQWALDSYAFQLTIELQILNKVDPMEAQAAAASFVSRFGEGTDGVFQALDANGRPMDGGFAALAAEYLETKKARRREAIMQQKREMLLDMESELSEDNGPAMEAKEIQR